MLILSLQIWVRLISKESSSMTSDLVFQSQYFCCIHSLNICAELMTIWGLRLVFTLRPMNEEISLIYFYSSIWIFASLVPWDWNVFIWNGTDLGWWWFRNFPVLTSRILRILFWAGKSAAGCIILRWQEQRWLAGLWSSEEILLTSLTMMILWI